jgi:hypothetical protein
MDQATVRPAATIIETLPDGRVVQLAAAGVPLPVGQANRMGILEIAQKGIGPGETKEAPSTDEATRATPERRGPGGGIISTVPTAPAPDPLQPATIEGGPERPLVVEPVDTGQPVGIPATRPAQSDPALNMAGLRASWGDEAVLATFGTTEAPVQPGAGPLHSGSVGMTPGGFTAQAQGFVPGSVSSDTTIAQEEGTAPGTLQGPDVANVDASGNTTTSSTTAPATGSQAGSTQPKASTSRTPKAAQTTDK